jgi:hypothetical protein
MSDIGWADALADGEPTTIRNEDPINKIFAKCFATTDGQRVLEFLRTKTIEQPTFIPGADASYGFAREGQNAIVREIELRVRNGRQN